MNLWSEWYSSFLLVSLRVESLVPRGGQRHHNLGYGDVVHGAGSFGVLEDVGAILSLSLPLLSLRDLPLAPGQNLPASLPAQVPPHPT